MSPPEAKATLGVGADTDGDSDPAECYRHEGTVERPMVQSGEPLKGELAAFGTAVRQEGITAVSAADGLAALRVATRIDELAARPQRRTEPLQ